MTGEQRIAAPRGRVWEALNDPAVLSQCIPGCQSLEKESDGLLRATVEIKIGPIGARFNGAVTLSDLDPPNGYTIGGEGQAGTVGFARGGAKVHLADDAGDTLLSYDVDAQVGGRLAQLGGPIIDATARQLAGRFFDKFGAIVGAQPPDASRDVQAAVTSGARAGSAIPADALPPPSPNQPLTWILALVVAVLVGFLVGRGQAGTGSDWMGLAIGLLIVIVAAVGFEFGRRAATPVVTLDAALLARLARAAEDRR